VSAIGGRQIVHPKRHCQNKLVQLNRNQASWRIELVYLLDSTDAVHCPDPVGIQCAQTLACRKRQFGATLFPTIQPCHRFGLAKLG
jgi:hypothetical protein